MDVSNKDIFKELYSKKINKEENYKKIVSYIEGKEGKMKKDFKWYVVPACLVVFICGFLVCSNGNSNSVLRPSQELPKTSSNEYLDILNINQVNQMKGLAKVDAAIKQIDKGDIQNYEMLSNVSVPDDFHDFTIRAIYIKGDKKQNSYDVLYNYEQNYQSNQKDRNITIAFSKENKPMRDYRFEGGKTSHINHFDLVIYQYENLYMTEFYYNGIYIDIETSNITEEEFITLLKSIIK